MLLSSAPLIGARPPALHSCRGRERGTGSCPRRNGGSRADIFGSGKHFDPQRFTAKFEAFRERWQIPRYVYLVEGDNRLLLDLEDRDQSNQLRLELTRRGDRGSVLLHEALPGPEHAWVEGSDGRYLAEFVVPLVLRPTHERLPVRRKR